MNLISNSVIYLTLISGTLITLTSSHWLLMWAGLEMSMFAMIPILTHKTSPRSTEAATKYFLVQATASMMFMMAIIYSVALSGQWAIMHSQNQTISSILMLSLMMKLGLAPFHLWVPEVTQGANLWSGMILLTWQKIAPLSIMYQTYSSANQTMIISFSLLSILLGGWGGLNQTQLRKILAYSSISHMGWMTTVMCFNPSIMHLNLLIYIMLTLSMFSMLSINTNTTTLSLSHLWNISPILANTILIILLSLGGLPPLTGFMPKWMIITEMTKNQSIILPTLMAMMALLNLFFYMRLAYSTSLTLFPSTNNLKMKWYTQNTKMPYLLPPLIIVSTLMLPLSPMMTTLE
ncbi:NADH dehydrogenase subunit 2 (mitochondrion) [Fukomys damarensis]|uniref:NADH-ubiquinone oxidoreductase chain 2 n=2 Tax=Bathyergidae TaxID=10167 RepID=G5CPG6_HETGA|nr:NADH dehydrogenase subunit 2 [Fukomys damarensis]AEM23553.1 NADH dehydrogenase subunit 2 [Heterocephalus glaber]AKU70844.1 NADH dehydrogenase subunit 2 [Fukomys damarensis]